MYKPKCNFYLILRYLIRYALIHKACLKCIEKKENIGASKNHKLLAEFHSGALSTGLFGRCSTGGRVFSTPSLTSLFIKLNYSNFVQNYFGIR